MATPRYTPEGEVDFMSMFMTQQQGEERQEQQYTMAASSSTQPTPVYPYPPQAFPAVSQYGTPTAVPVLTPIEPTTASSPPPLSAIHSSPAAMTVSSPGPSSPVQSEAPEAKQPAKRKRKLSPEDKRRICETYRNSQGKIRQEDIAREYSVDRSTISKILNQEERWLDPDAPGAVFPTRRPGGRYPAIEEEMHRWLDDAVMCGREIRDAEAREEALRVGLRLGHPHFQASSKWWDGVKRRRVEEGRPMPNARRHTMTPPFGMPNLARSYSSMGMEPYPRQAYPMAMPNYLPPMQAFPVGVRSRSQSSPQVIPEFAQQAPSFGPVRSQRFSPPRPANAAALRQWTFPNGSPARPMSRAGSNQGMSQHAHLGASAFGFAPAPSGELAPPAEMEFTPGHVPALSQSMSPLSVAISDSDATGASALSPSTPITPSQAAFSTAPIPSQHECVDYNAYGQAPQMLYGHQSACIPEMQYSQPFYPGYEFVQPQW